MPARVKVPRRGRYSDRVLWQGAAMPEPEPATCAEAGPGSPRLTALVLASRCPAAEVSGRRLMPGWWKVVILNTPTCPRRTALVLSHKAFQAETDARVL